MDWLVYAGLMFTASNCLYLLIRKAQKQQVPLVVYSTALFLLPAIGYLGLSIISQISLMVGFKTLITFLLVAFFWSYLGNYFSQRGILLAPNPGYSLVISKSVVVINTFAAYWLFGAELNWSKLLGILIIVGGNLLVSLSKSRKRGQASWLGYSLGALICWAFGTLISKHWLNLGFHPYIYLFYVCLAVAIMNLIEVKISRVAFSLDLLKANWWLVLMIGIFSLLFNTFIQFAYAGAPNLGYVSAINVASIASVAVLSAIFFKDELSWRKLTGIGLVVIGLFAMLF